MATGLSVVYNFNKEHVGLAFLFGGILSFLGVGYNKLQMSKEEKKGVSRFIKVTFIIWLFLSVFSVIIFINSKQNYYLPLKYFLVVSLAATIILIQILFPKQPSKSEVYVILLEIFILSGIVSGSFLFLFPGPYGNDASYHVGFIKNIIATGNLGGYPGSYQNYPGYHLLFVFIGLITETSLKVTQFIIAIIQILFSIFIFMLTRKIFNDKAALISTLFVTLSPYLLISRYYYFPNAFSVIFFTLILYLFFYPNAKTAAFVLLLIIVFAAIVFTHPLTPAILIVAFLAIFTVSKLLKLEKINVSARIILFMSVFTLGWWMRPIGTQRDLFSGLILSIKNALETVDYAAVERATLAPLYNWTDIVLIDLGFTTLILLAIAGTFYSLRDVCISTQTKKLTQNQEKVFTLSVVTLLFIPIPYILTLIYPNSLPARWFPFIEVLASMFAGVSVLFIFHKISKYKLQSTVFLILFYALIFFMITSVANPNSQLYAKELSGRSALTESEISAGNFINSLHLQQIHANSKYIAFVNRRLANPRDFINPNDPSTYNSGLLVVRNYDLEKGFIIPLFGSKGKLLEIIYPNEEFYASINKSNKIYENGKVILYLKE